MGIAGALAFTIAVQSAPAVEPIEQVRSEQEAPSARGVDQLGASSREVGTAQFPERDVRAPAQLSTVRDTDAPTPQLSEVERRARNPSQLNTSGRTAQAPSPLSSPTEGRRGDQAAVGGRDRCDQADPDPATRAACARVIETRSAEFARPDPVTLSPEQRILVEQRLREAPATGRSLTRRMAEGAAANPDDLENQEVAAIVLGQPGAREDTNERESRQEVDAQAEAAAAIVQAIINGAQAGPR